MKIRDIMTKEVFGCSPDSSLTTAAQIMLAKDCGALPVLKPDGGVVGMITDRDISLIISMTHRAPAEIWVGEVMSKPVYACGLDDPIPMALRWMAAVQVRRLPVIDQRDALQGILSLSDIMACYLKSTATAAEVPPVSCQDLIEAYGRICEPRRQTAGIPEITLAAIA